jgi:hypothetical protein
VELRSPPASTEDPMTDDRMALVELLPKSCDSDFLRSVAEGELQILTETSPFAKPDDIRRRWQRRYAVDYDIAFQEIVEKPGR